MLVFDTCQTLFGYFTAKGEQEQVILIKLAYFSWEIRLRLRLPACGSWFGTWLRQFVAGLVCPVL
jgi:hypothetical protein